MHALLLGVVLAQLTPGPALSVSATSVNLNPAQQQVVTVTGAAAPLQATLDRRLVNASVSSDGTSVTITATQATGSDVLHLVDANGAQATIAIRVAFNAGTIVPQTTLSVTGNPLDPDWLSARGRALGHRHHASAARRAGDRRSAKPRAHRARARAERCALRAGADHGQRRVLRSDRHDGRYRAGRRRSAVPARRTLLRRRSGARRHKTASSSAERFPRRRHGSTTTMTTSPTRGAYSSR